MKALLGTVALSVIIVTLGLAHDLFLKLETYFVPTKTAIRIAVLNGSFTTSEAAVTPDRLADLSFVGPDGRRPLSRKAWQPAGDSTWLEFRTGYTGTYVIGASTQPRELTLTGEEFNRYLEEEGLVDVLAMRANQRAAIRPVRERYQKHVKAVIQVGESRSPGFSTRFEYPAELVPLTNPYAVQVGDTLAFIALVDGKPMREQIVIAGGDYQGRERALVRERSDARGAARFVISEPGRWFVKFIHMIPAPGGVDYESQWATLTFEVPGGARP